MQLILEILRYSCRVPTHIATLLSDAWHFISTRSPITAPLEFHNQTDALKIIDIYFICIWSFFSQVHMVYRSHGTSHLRSPIGLAIHVPSRSSAAGDDVVGVVMPTCLLWRRNRRVLWHRRIVSHFILFHIILLSLHCTNKTRKFCVSLCNTCFIAVVYLRSGHFISFHVILVSFSYIYIYNETISMSQ